MSIQVIPFTMVGVMALSPLVAQTGGSEKLPPHRKHRELPTREERIKALQRRLSRIREIWEDHNGCINDPNYLWVYGNRLAITPILADSIMSEQPMAFPYSEPTPPRFSVGDLSFFLLCDWQVVDYDKIMSEFLTKETMKAEGVYAYHDWIVRPGNRALLHAAVVKQIRLVPRPNWLPN